MTTQTTIELENKLAKAYAGIKENTTPLETGVELAELAKKYASLGEIVEIGTNVGMSAIAFSNALLDSDKKIHTVDIYHHPDFTANTKNAGVSHKIEQYVGPSHIIAKKFKEKVGLLFIDGDHFYKGVKTDIQAWCQKVEVGGIIVFDDYPGHKKSKSKYKYKYQTNVFKAVNKWILCKPYEYRIIKDRQVGSLLVVEKIHNEISESESLYSRIYWVRRNLRMTAVKCFPGLSRQYAKKNKEKNLNGRN